MSKQITAMHKYITPQCRANKGDDQCRKEVIDEADKIVKGLLDGWGADADIKVHVKVILEKPGE
jgi:hypothetical protein